MKIQYICKKKNSYLALSSIFELEIFTVKDTIFESCSTLSLTTYSIVVQINLLLWPLYVCIRDWHE